MWSTLFLSQDTLCYLRVWLTEILKHKNWYLEISFLSGAFPIIDQYKETMSHVQWSSRLTAGGLWILQSTNGLFLHMSVRQVKFFRKIRVVLYEMEFWVPLRVAYGLIHCSHSLPKGQFHNLVFLAPWMISKHPLSMECDVLDVILRWLFLEELLYVFIDTENLTLQMINKNPKYSNKPSKIRFGSTH